MKILLIGSGGREHALALKLKAGATPVDLFSAPGSDAIGELGTCLPFDAEDVGGITAWCAEQRPDLVLVGPEAPLVVGLSDAITALNIPVFGHPKATAMLEGSKSFSKAFMMRHKIPCAEYLTVRTLEEGEEHIRDWTMGYPIVLKADGLAAGKGVVLAQTQEEALTTLRAFLGGQFGEASKVVLLEQPLRGMELSFHVLVDVTRNRAEYVMMPPCQDHKRIFEGDQGPNTGGMGAFGPIPFLTERDCLLLETRLVHPTLMGMKKEGMEGRGVLFLGVMWTEAGPKLLEYNVRFGDPETQVLMELLDEDLPSLLLDVATHRLPGSRWAKSKLGCAITVVLAAEGYPDSPTKGVPIAVGDSGLTLVHAGTKRKDGQWLTHGGRVLNLVTRADDLAEARAKIASALPAVSWPGMQVRRDIGLRALEHAKTGKSVADPW